MNSKIWIISKTKNHYKLISKLNDLDIKVFNVNYNKENISVLINKNDYIRITKYLISYDFKVIKNTGISYIINKIKVKKLLVFSIVLSIILLFLMNNIIVTVDVIHENNNLRSLIYDELKENDIKPLTFKKSYDDLDKVKNVILEKYKDKIEWLEINRIGMKYEIKLEERIINEGAVKDDFCNVYAKEKGMITSISVHKGVPVVKIGDYVNVGDLLITGEIIYNNEIKNEVCASGIIRAEKWYETSIVIPYNYTSIERTGEVRNNLLWEHENYKTRILNDRINNYESEYIEIFDLFGYKLSLERQYETKEISYTYSKEEAIEKALLLSEEKMEHKLDDEESIIYKKVLKNNENNSTIEVDIFIVTEEIIN